MQEQNNVIKLDKKYNIRKWKAKEKKEFLNTIKRGDSLDTLQNVLVYNCIEGDAAFNPDEFKFVLTKIREYSLGSELNLEFFCEKCKSKFLKVLNISDIIKPIYKNINTIKTNNYNIQLTSIRNCSIYKETIEKFPENSYEYDFYLRIESINDNDAMTLDEIVELFDNMDIDEFDNIFNQWEDIRFKINDEVDVSCSSCGNTVRYSFDSIPGFFPVNWFK